LLLVALNVTPNMMIPWINAARKQVVSIRSLAGGNPAPNMSFAFSASPA
jgi:hypothetical protein